jgi:hypothetical protein
MFEIKAGSKIDMRMLEPLGAMGYEFYRLLPGPLILAPFDPSNIDAYQLNLFACKADRARKLNAGGFLGEADGSGAAASSQTAWMNYARSAPYARELVSKWPSKAGFFSGGGLKVYMDGLAAFAESRDIKRGATDRMQLLEHAFYCVSEALDASDTLARRLSYTRLAWELGWRARSVEALGRARDRLADESIESLEEPFIAPSPRYEQTPVGAGAADWLKCAVIEQYGKLAHHSSIFSGIDSLRRLEPIRRLPQRSVEVDRRCQLAGMLFGPQAEPERTPMLCAQSEENLNPEIWSGSWAALLRRQ